MATRFDQPPGAPSAWLADAEPPGFPALSRDEKADVCIIGGGIAGLTAAYMLLQEGRCVVVLEDGEIASGMTRMTTAHLSSALDDRYRELERLRGAAVVRMAAESHGEAIARIQAIARAEGIECDFRRVDGFLFAHDGDGRRLGPELAAARRAGLKAERLERAPLSAFDTGPCLVFPGQGQFHPLKYMAGLARAVAAYGGRIYAHTRADSVRDGKPARVQAGRHTVTAASVIVATNIPVTNRVALHLKQAAYMTYAIGMAVAHGSVPAALYWDDADPYHYVRIQPGEDGDLLIVGGEDHRTGQNPLPSGRQHDRLEAWTRARFRVDGPVRYRWGGQVVETPDGLAHIGRNPGAENVYVATGDSGMGITHGTIAGMLLTDLICGRANRWEPAYDPSRRHAGSLLKFLPETLKSTVPMTDWITPGAGTTEGKVGPSSGAVLRRGLSKSAVYRDASGTLHEFSAVCPHLGCLVRWNATLKTFDCPCHGSRFDGMGRVINGPANEDLRPL